jgi:hypothetical protein
MLTRGVRKRGMEYAVFKFMDERIKFAIFKKKLRGFWRAINRSPKPELQQQKDGTSECESRCFTLSYTRQEADVWKTYRGTTPTKKKHSKAGKFCPVGSEIGDGKCNV